MFHHLGYNLFSNFTNTKVEIDAWTLFSFIISFKGNSKQSRELNHKLCSPWARSTLSDVDKNGDATGCNKLIVGFNRWWGDNGCGCGRWDMNLGRKKLSNSVGL